MPQTMPTTSGETHVPDGGQVRQLHHGGGHQADEQDAVEFVAPGRGGGAAAWAAGEAGSGAVLVEALMAGLLEYLNNWVEY